MNGQLCLSFLLLNFSHFSLLDDNLKGEGNEEVPIALVELGLELDPVQSESVEEGG